MTLLGRSPLSLPSLPSSLLLYWVVILVSSVDVVKSWGEDGHIMIANLAWRRLSPDVQRKVSTILNISNATEVKNIGSPMGVVANWADHVRHFLPWSGSLHFIDVRDDLIEGGCHYQYNSSKKNNDYSVSSSSSDLCEFQYYHRDCVDGICVAGAILNYSMQLIEQQQQYIQHKGELRKRSNNIGLSTASSPHFLRRRLMNGEKDKKYDFPAIYDTSSLSMRQALMFLIHFIGDIHQPLHVSRSSDRGGNNIPVKYHLLDKGTTTNTTIDNDRKKGDSNFVTERNSRSHHHSYNLHSVWDTAMIKTVLERDYSFKPTTQPRYEMEAALESLLTNHTEWLDYFTRCQSGSGARHLECVIGWGQESWSYALKYAYTKNSPWELSATEDDELTSVVEVASGDEINEAYYESRIPIVKQQLIAGGIRLAATLEDIFSSKDDNEGINNSNRRSIQRSFSMEGIHAWSYISQFRY